MRVSVIINPIAGFFRRPEQGPRRAAQARAVLAAARVEADVWLTEGPGHARALAADATARGADVVYAWGGDGTVNEVGSALAFGETALAIVPAGSGNGLARALGIPREAGAALRHALQMPERRIDVGEIGGPHLLQRRWRGLRRTHCLGVQPASWPARLSPVRAHRYARVVRLQSPPAPCGD